MGMASREKDGRKQRGIGVGDAQRARGVRGDGDQPARTQGTPVRSLSRAPFREMKAIEAAGKTRIVCCQQNQPRHSTQGLRQPMAPLGIARTQNHDAAFGQFARSPQGIGKPFVIRHHHQKRPPWA